MNSARNDKAKSCLRQYECQDAEAPILVCFPHAGGAASAFYPFVDELTERWQLMIVQYPGRECRYSTQLSSSLLQTADEIAGSLKVYQHRDMVFFGHSMGAKVAFEVAALLSDKPTMLIASCSPAPDIFPKRGPLTDYSDAALEEYLHSLGGTVTDLLHNKELMELVLPIIRADFKSLDDYTRAVDKRSLDMPILAMVADKDDAVDETLAKPWGHWTNSEFTTLAVQGDHFYFQKQGIGLAAYIDQAQSLISSNRYT